MINNRLTELFARKKADILSLYFTAGFPMLSDTLPIAQAATQAGADILEIGIPFSDPIADGPTIQQSNDRALANGMTVPVLLEQLQDLRKYVDIPVLLMGYLNPVMQYGIESFCKDIAKIGIDGLILPDLPISVYQNEYKPTFEQHQLSNIFLITPQTTDERIKKIDEITEGFIYMVSTSSTTGRSEAINQSQENYFKKINEMNLQNPRLIGFGIADQASFQKACQYAQGAIIGSAFIKHLSAHADTIPQSVANFIGQIKQKQSSASLL